MLWHLGNTTVRNPYRLREGLIAIYNSSIHGFPLRGKVAELELIKVLNEKNIIKGRGDKTYSIGRKWRAALTQLGFLYPKIPAKLKGVQEKLGKIDTITPNGKRLIETESLIGWQECFLRSLSAYRIPSVMEPYSCEHFSPLRYVLRVMLELEKKMEESTLYFMEMAVIVQCTTPSDDINEVVEKILVFREQREKAQYKKKFDRDCIEKMAKKLKYEASTFKDYADVNFRYLKVTGLVRSKGKGIIISPSKKVLIQKLITEKECPYEDLNYLKSLTNGDGLPFDNKVNAKKILTDLEDTLKKRGKKLDLTERKLNTVADYSIARHEAEETLMQLDEIEFSKRQQNQVDEIIEYMKLLNTNSRAAKGDGENGIKIPKEEAPAYFEWIIWRAFLAINSLENKPWESRRFKIDQDFLPIHTAPGGGPDMVFVFKDFVLVVEVTLTRSSLQESAENESVRRHIAKYVEQYSDKQKKVFGLFIAVNVDMNTINIFRSAEWYIKDDKKVDLEIVPIFLNDFIKLMSCRKNNINTLLEPFFNLIKSVRSIARSSETPVWKNRISSLVEKIVI